MKLPDNISRSFYKVGFQVKKHSPEILLVAGIAGVVTSAVMACKATTKVHDILEETKTDIESIHEFVEAGEIKGTEYTEEDGKKDTAIIYVQTGVKLAKLYAPAVGLGVLSITSILASNNIMRKRNVALAAAYNVLDNSFKGYRNRVIERFGEELDKELKYDIKAEKIQETITDENGEEKVVERTVTVANINENSDYARFYDCGNRGWTKDPELNMFNIKRAQDWANDKLKSQGYLFLNDVYEMLGYKKTKAGQVVGWYYDPINPSGDNYVDFGIYRPINSLFVNGDERTCIIDFNVDGNIMHRFKDILN